MFRKANFYFIPYTFFNHIGGGGDESTRIKISYHIAHERQSTYHPIFSVAIFSILIRTVFNSGKSF